MHAHARSDGRVGHAPVPFMERGSTHAQACSFSTRVSYQPQPAQLAQLAQLSESDSARAHAPAHPTRSDAQGTEGWEREELYRAHAHTCGRHSDGTNCNRYLTSAIHVPSLSRAKSSAWVVAAGRLLCLAEPHTPARVFLGPAHRTLGGPHSVGVCSTIQSSLHTFLYYDEQPR